MAVLDPVTGMPKKTRTAAPGGSPFAPPPMFNPDGTPNPSLVAPPGGGVPSFFDFGALVASNPNFLTTQQTAGMQFNTTSSIAKQRRDLASAIASSIVSTTRMTSGERLALAKRLAGEDLALVQRLTSEMSALDAQQKTAQGGRAQVSAQAELGQIGHAGELEKRAIPNVLAARGLLFSGETGFQQREQEFRQTSAEQDTQRQLSDYLAGLEEGFARAELGRSQQVSQATLGSSQQVATAQTGFNTANQEAAAQAQRERLQAQFAFNAAMEQATTDREIAIALAQLQAQMDTMNNPALAPPPAAPPTEQKPGGGIIWNPVTGQYEKFDPPGSK